MARSPACHRAPRARLTARVRAVALSCSRGVGVASMQEITFNGRQYRVEGEQVWMYLDAASVHRQMEWGNRKNHWRALPKNSPLRRYLVKIARGEKADMPRLE